MLGPQSRMWAETGSELNSSQRQQIVRTGRRNRDRAFHGLPPAHLREVQRRGDLRRLIHLAVQLERSLARPPRLHQHAPRRSSISHHTPVGHQPRSHFRGFRSLEEVVLTWQHGVSSPTINAFCNPSVRVAEPFPRESSRALGHNRAVSCNPRPRPAVEGGRDCRQPGHGSQVHHR